MRFASLSGYSALAVMGLVLGLLGGRATESRADEACPNLTGVYRFNGFDRDECRQFRTKNMRLSPIELGKSVRPGETVTIQQKDCSELTITNIDMRFINQPEVRVVIPIGTGKKAEWKKGRLVYHERDAGTVCYFGCLSAIDGTGWSLGLNDNGDLDYKYKSTMVGAYNFVVPLVDLATAHCELERR